MTWIRKILPWLGVLIGIALIYDGVVFYSRWSERRDAEKKAAASAQAQRERTVNAIGGGGLKILSFYAAPASVHRGQQTTLCYSVAGAMNVTLEPHVDEVWPALSRCVKASPKKTTEYTFTAEDGAGHSALEKLTVEVR
jgi:hypothetical protein